MNTTTTDNNTTWKDYLVNDYNDVKEAVRHYCKVTNTDVADLYTVVKYIIATEHIDESNDVDIVTARVYDEIYTAYKH